MYVYKPWEILVHIRVVYIFGVYPLTATIVSDLNVACPHTCVAKEGAGIFRRILGHAV